MTIAKVFGRVLRTGLSSLRDRAAARLTALRFNPSRIVCHILGHAWQEEDGNWSKRICTRCERREILCESLYPAIGEPRYYWRHFG